MKLRMKTASDVRRALQKVGNMVLDGQIEPRAANAFVYCASTLLTSLRTDEQDAKLKELEELLKHEND